jgi:hypothetical protein
LAVGEYFLDIGVDFVFNAGLLRGQVDELHLLIAGKPAPTINGVGIFRRL